MSKSQNLLKLALIALTSVILTACGGGGGGSSSSSGGNNNPPDVNDDTTTDTTAPTEPRLISLASADASSMDVDWIGSSDDHTGSALIEYQIHAATSSGFTPDSSTLQSSLSNTISATITGLDASTEYFVVVLAVDEAGNQSPSEEKSVTTSASTAIASDEAVPIEADAITTVADDSVTLEKTSATEALQVDDILVSDQSDGLLLKVESVTDNGSELEVVTTQATLVDAFEQVEFNLLTTLEDIDTSLETQGLLPTGQSARGLSSPTLRSNQSFQELRWPSGLRLQQEDLGARSSSMLFQPALSTSEVQAIDTSKAGTLASAYEVYATSSDAIISFDVVLEVESGHSFGDIEVDISHNKLSTPNYEVIDKSSTSSRKEYRIQWDNSGASSTAPFEVDISAQEQDCWWLCTLNVRTEVYTLDSNKDSLFDDKYVFRARNSSGSAEVTATTSIGFSPDFDVFVQVEGRKVEQALAQITGELKLENTLEFLASSSSDVDNTKTLFTKKFTKIIMAGTVPIVISGKLQLDGEVSASISGEVSLDATAESSVTVSAGVKYTDGKFTFIDNADTTYKFEVTGDAGTTIKGELRLIPEIDISFYRVVGAEMTLEPYVFSEATLEGQFKAMIDNNFADATANYRFSELKAGIAMDASITAKLGIILDNRTIGPELTWNNNGDAVLGPYYLISLPSAEISALSAASPANGLLLGLETSSGKLGFVKDNRVVNGYWQVYPEDSSTAFSVSGSGARFDYSTDAEYELRYVYYSDLGSFIRQYENFDVDLSDSDNDGLNNQYENFYSFLDPENPLDADDDHDNDGYDNLSEYQNGSDPGSSSSYPSSDSDDALPSDFTATAGNEQVNLSWTRYANSTVYNIYRSDNPNCDLININTCSTTSGQSELFSNVSSPFTDTGLNNGTTYYYWIEAIHDGQVQLAENYISATPQETTTELIAFTLNDTGIDWGGNHESGNNTDCSSNIEAPQDCHQGRDATHNDDSDGHAGFSFTKLDSNGNTLDASASSWSCVQDNVTGLIWEVKTDDGSERDKDNTYRWGGLTAIGRDSSNSEGDYYDDWNNLVNTANSGNGFCGFTDWRVPAIEELRSIVDYSRDSRFSIDTNYFPNTRSSLYWSASTYTEDVNNAWLLSFNNGNDIDYDRSDSYFVRLVNSVYNNDSINNWINERYEINGDGTVTDTVTDLMWMQCSLGQNSDDNCSGHFEPYYWQGALQAAENSNFADYYDWRLPNIKELSSLAALDRYAPAINEAIFPNTPLDSYWSSTPNVSYDGYTWMFNFYYGEDYTSPRHHGLLVRLVRYEPNTGSVGVSGGEEEGTGGRK